MRRNVTFSHSPHYPKIKSNMYSVLMSCSMITLASWVARARQPKQSHWLLHWKDMSRPLMEATNSTYQEKVKVEGRPSLSYIVLQITLFLFKQSNFNNLFFFFLEIIFLHAFFAIIKKPIYHSLQNKHVRTTWYFNVKFHQS